MSYPVGISAIHLARIGEYAVVSAEIGGQWFELIRERYDGAFSHIIETSGIRGAAGLDDVSFQELMDKVAASQQA